ncbi:MAG: hypothetical protein ACI93R_002573 [Flavobacteriales bacterium]|jgi:hypothetical protein
MSELIENVNWIAVIVGAVVSFAVGGLWYSPKLFGAKWAEGVRLTPEQATKMSIPAMVVQLLATFLLSWVVGITAANEALFTVILITLTIFLLVVSAGLFAKKSLYAIFTEAGFIVIMVFLMIVVQGLI